MGLVKVWTDGNRKVWFRKGLKSPEHCLTLNRFDLLKRSTKWKLLHIAHSTGRRTVYDLKKGVSYERE